MRLPPRVVRRSSAPLLLALELALLAVFVAGVVVTVIVAPLTPRRRPLRVCAFAVGYLAVEIAAGFAALWLWVCHPRCGRHRPLPPQWTEPHERLLHWALGAILACARRCFGFEVVPDVRPGPLDADAPALVIARHAGPGDSFALVHLLLSRHRAVRIVLKDVLQLDPALDVVLNRLGSCFLPPEGASDQDLPARLAAMAVAMSGRDTLLVFPEGGNWTPARRRRAIRRLRSDDKLEAARAATLMTHVLPPRPAGVLAVLAARPELPVVVVAHAGIDRIVTARQAWGAVPLTTAMTVRAWPAAPVPPMAEGAAAQLQWLTTEWATVDEWVDAQRHPTGGDGPTPPGPLVAGRRRGPGRLGP